MTKTKNTQEPTKEQIAAWKQAHGKLFAMRQDGELVAILRKPNIKDIGRANSFANRSKDAYAFNDNIINNCALWEVEGLRKNDDALLGVYTELDRIIEIAETHVEEL